MRASFWLLAAASACGSPARPASTPAAAETVESTPGITAPAELERELRSGMVVAVEIVDGSDADVSVVGSCTIVFDLWDKQFVVRHGEADDAKVPDLAAALSECLGTEPMSALTARVAAGEPPDPLKRSPEPVF